MSSLGFTPQSNDHELEKLREVWRSLADVLRNITNAETSLESRNYQVVADHWRGKVERRASEEGNHLRRAVEKPKACKEPASQFLQPLRPVEGLQFKFYRPQSP